MSIESKVENFFKGLVSQIPPAHKRSKSTVNGGNKEDGEEEKNGSHERGRKDSVRKVKTRSSSKNPQKKEASKPTSPVLQHVDDFPDVPQDNSIIFARRNSESKKKKHAVPISATEPAAPQWSDRFRQLRGSLQRRAMKNSVSPQPGDKAAIFEDQSKLPPTQKLTPKQRSKSKTPSQQSPYDEASPIHRTTLTIEASKVSSDTDQSDKTIKLKPETVKKQPSRRSRSVAPSDSRIEPLSIPITTHFPISDKEPVTVKDSDKQFDPYGGYILTEADRKSTQAESGYLSALELSIPRSTSMWSQTSPAIESPPIRERHRARSSSRGTIFDRNVSIRSKSRATTPESQRRSRLSAAKSEINLRRYERSSSVGWALEMLRDRVQETKYVTAVFESTRGGIYPILPDILKELGHWLGPKSRLLAVACEVHWSVPESVRSRVVEIKMKDELHRVLRQNNKRVLQLYDERRGSFPLSLIESKTEESCARDSTLDAFQGIYRRYYPELLNLQDAQTVSSHKSYWALDTLDSEQKALQPSPAKFLFHPNRNILGRKSVVALNMAVLRMIGDDSDYERASISSSIVY